jgi:hypothetical protein
MIEARATSERRTLILEQKRRGSLMFRCKVPLVRFGEISMKRYLLSQSEERAFKSSRLIMLEHIQ